MTGNERDNPIVFFDGVCNLCNAAVDWIMARDRQRKFRFASLQGETAARLLPESDRIVLGSIVLLKNGAYFRRSAAIVEIFADLSGPWSLVAKILKLVPRPIRDIGYRLIARYRYAIFGKRETCRLPTPDEKALLLE